MPYSATQAIEACTICGKQANILRREFQVGTVVDCSWCGDFAIDHILADKKALPLGAPEKRALASHLIRQMNGALISAKRVPMPRPVLTEEFFEAVSTRSLPSPAEATDNLLLYLAMAGGSSPGKTIKVDTEDGKLTSSVGVVDGSDVSWLVRNLLSLEALTGNWVPGGFVGTFTGLGWARVAELHQSEATSTFAFFARQFTNPELDTVFERCLVPAVLETGFELRIVTQRAGLVDAIIEDEIRRCAFVIADLSDDNAGAYWEAGFAEGLGKPVIYVCKAKDGRADKRTHFDANHRHTVRWDLATLDQTAKNLKAVIRNTLLGRAR